MWKQIHCPTLSPWFNSHKQTSKTHNTRVLDFHIGSIDSAHVRQFSIILLYICSLAMAENYHYPRFQSPWIQQMDSRELFPHGLLPPSSAQQLLYHNLQLQGLQQTIGRYMTCQTRPTKTSRTFTNSATSSPLSTLSCEESLDVVNTASASGHEAAEFRTLSPATPQADHHCHQLLPSTQMFDIPMDLSKPKSHSNINKCGSTTSHSRLATLLTRKRSSGSCSHQEQSKPLNLSKKLCLSSRPESPSESCNAIDMKDAVDNPVQLVKLINQTRVAEQVTKFLNQVSVSEKSSLKKNWINTIMTLIQCWHFQWFFRILMAKFIKKC